MLEILYEDNHLIICVKPVGILSQPDPSGDVDMISLVKEYLDEKKNNSYVGLVHRLDRNVGGVMVFSKNHNITGKLSQLIQERNFTKEYITVVHNKPEEEEGILKDLLFKDSSKNKTFVVARARKGVKEASLDYKLLNTAKLDLKEDKVVSLIKVHLHTGRTHQIRVQFASRKMPLLGDGKYGSKDNGCEIALWSYRLAFNHPMKKSLVDVSKMPPQVYPFDLFN